MKTEVITECVVHPAKQRERSMVSIDLMGNCRNHLVRRDIGVELEHWAGERERILSTASIVRVFLDEIIVKPKGDFSIALARWTYSGIVSAVRSPSRAAVVAGENSPSTPGTSASKVSIPFIEYIDGKPEAPQVKMRMDILNGTPYERRTSEDGKLLIAQSMKRRPDGRAFAD